MSLILFAAASSDDAYGGTIVANSATHTVMTELAVFCAQAAKQHMTSDKNGEK